MSINYSAAILYLYPNAIPDQDFRLEDHGGGPQITLWEETAIGGPQPTEQELQDASDAAAVIAAAEAQERQDEIDVINTLVGSSDLGNFDAEDTQTAIEYLLRREKRRIDGTP
jgi:hypothetical protein